MVDLNTLILNSCQVADIGDKTLPQIKSDELQIQKDELDDNDILMAQGSFILLLTELLTHGATAQSPVTETKKNEPESLNLTSEIQQINHDLNVSKEQVDPDYVSQVEEQNMDTIDSVHLNQKPVVNLDSNVALSWINYEHFESPIPGSTESADAEQFLSELKYMSLEQTKDTTQYQSPIINTAQQGNAENEQVIPNNTLLEYLDFVLPQTHDASADTLDTLAKDTVANPLELAPSLSDKSIPVLSQALEYDSSAIQPTLNHAQLNQNISETIKLKMLDIPLPLSDAQWADKFSEHIVWLGHQSVKSAVIKINPEELGPLEISVKVIKDAASVNITSHNSHIRDIVDQALPRLRDMMSEQGLDLAEVTFDAGTSTDSRQSEHQKSGANNELMFDGEEGTMVTSLKKKPPKGLIDYFA